MFPELSPCVNGQQSEYPFSVNANESEYSIIGGSGNIYESGKISSSVNLVSVTEFEGRTVIYGPSFSPSKYGVSTNRPIPIVLVKCWKVAHWNAKKLLKNCQKSKKLLPKFQKLLPKFLAIFI